MCQAFLLRVSGKPDNIPVIAILLFNYDLSL